MKTSNPHDEKYAEKEYYWGKKPSAICDRVIELMHPTRDFRPKLVDLGCGEGRNAVYFAKNGFDVVGLYISETGHSRFVLGHSSFRKCASIQESFSCPEELF